MTSVHNGDKYAQNGTAAAKYAPREARKEVKQLPGRVVGFISVEYGIAWVVSPFRNDKRTGANHRSTFGEYAQELLDAASLGNVKWTNRGHSG